MSEDKETTAPEAKKRRARPGLFFGLVFLVWGVSMILDTYLDTDLLSNLFPMLAIIFGAYLVYSGLDR